MRDFFIFSMLSRVLLSRIKLNRRLGFSARNYSYETLADSRSGASSRKQRFTKSISYSLGRVRSSRRAIKLESIPPENSTAILQPGSLLVAQKTPLTHLMISLILYTNNFLIVASIFSTLSTYLTIPIFLRSS
jgi:hypothetical protein